MLSPLAVSQRALTSPRALTSLQCTALTSPSSSADASSNRSLYCAVCWVSWGASGDGGHGSSPTQLQEPEPQLQEPEPVLPQGDPSPPPLPTSSDAPQPVSNCYYTRTIEFGNRRCAVICQDENGPCPLYDFFWCFFWCSAYPSVVNLWSAYPVEHFRFPPCRHPWSPSTPDNM